MTWLNEIEPSANIVIVQPNYRTSRLLLAECFARGSCAYVSFRGQNLDIAELEDQLWGEFNDLNQLNPEYVVLDECDRARPESLLDLVRLILSEIDTTVVIFGRILPDVFLDNHSESMRIALYPIEPALSLYNYFAPRDKTLLFVHAFGRGRAFVNGREILDWGGEQARMLFFFMIDSPIITRDMIFTEFWPDLPPNAATNVFHVTKHNVSKMLGFELFRYSEGFYRLSSEIDLIYDVREYHQVAQRGSIELDEAMLHEAISRFEGDFLVDSDMFWVVNRREELNLSYSEILSLQAENFLRQGNLDKALQLFLRASALQIGREDVTEHIMKLYFQMEQPQLALRAFQRTKAYLKEMQDLQPNQKLLELAEYANQDDNDVDHVG